MKITMKSIISFNTIRRMAFIVGPLSLSLLTGCKKYLDVPLPVNSVAAAGAFTSDASVSSVVTGNFILMSSNSVIAGSGCTSYNAGLYTDELNNLNPSSPSQQGFYTDIIQGSIVNQWTQAYSAIYQVNAAIAGIQNSTAQLYNRNQWLGESLFTRAVFYFYLTNLYGDVPLALTTDYKTNNNLARAPQSQVYQQIIADLKQAQALLSVDYKDGNSTTTTNRARPNQAAATALLARVYLYTRDWANAETQASSVINNTAYQLVAPNLTFLSTSQESVWSLAMPSNTYVPDFTLYNSGMPAVIPNGNTPLTYNVSVCLSQSLVTSFEPNDTRFANWVRSSTVLSTPAVTYYFPNKYKSNAPGTESIVVLRLAEQYLIRAEARAEQNTNLSGAQADLNAVRARAGLPATTASSQTGLLTAIANERRVEFFTEFGHRFLDLKRTGTIDAVMGVAAPLKGGAWSSYKSLWPIVPTDILQDPNLTQNPGYQQ
jgi:hypothetical protein